MTTDAIRRAIEFLRSRQNPDGGWGYRPGGDSLVEPTGLCLVALFSRGDKIAVGRGLDFLKACLKESGAVGINPRDPEGSWMAYAALLAFRDLGAATEERRLTDWILSFEDASGRLSPDNIKAISNDYRYDASIRGWPWTPNTMAWVEPTALFIIALVRSGVPPTHKRIRSGISLILDRKVPSGGWNFGNPYSKSHELEASFMSTAIALAALGAAGVPGSQPAIGEGIRFLARGLAGDVSTASLAWILLALKSYPNGASMIPGTAARLAHLQAVDGSFRLNLFETALAYLALSDPAILIRTPGKGL
ncbi:MAG: hypothetical protein MUQ25_12085 [Candidatus Aminicenantes bacterium]|nr:hypothetical protein [Candidatus Aminicenantes bacterium]